MANNTLTPETHIQAIYMSFLFFFFFFILFYVYSTGNACTSNHTHIFILALEMHVQVTYVSDVLFFHFLASEMCVQAIVHAFLMSFFFLFVFSFHLRCMYKKLYMCFLYLFFLVSIENNKVGTVE